MQWSEIPRQPSARALRQFAGGLLALASIVAWRLWIRGAHEVAVSIFAIGLLASAVGLARPTALRLVFVGWLTAVFPIGWAIGHSALAIVFYCVVTPIAFVARMGGRDRLRRKARGLSSYWRAKAPRDVRSYYSQF